MIFLPLLFSWYFSGYAFLVYLILFLAIIAWIYVWQKRTINELRQEFINHRTDTLSAKSSDSREGVDDETIQALKAQLKSKTIELATKAKENEEKIELINSIKAKISQLQQRPNALDRIVSEINVLIESMDVEEDHMFEIQMDELHQELFKKLKTDFPGLTNNDLRLCAYIKNGFNSKEIADLFNIKPSSVYISRSRLRKKLELEPEEDLLGFLSSF